MTGAGLIWALVLALASGDSEVLDMGTLEDCEAGRAALVLEPGASAWCELVDPAGAT